MNYYLGPFEKIIQPENGVSMFAPPDGSVGTIDLRSLPGHALPGVGIFAFDTPQAFGLEYLFLGAGTLQTITPDVQTRNKFAQMLGIQQAVGVTLADMQWNVLTVQADPKGLTAPKPLMPTKGLALELHIAGEKVSKPFTIAMPEAANVIEVEKETYRQAREDSLAGRAPPQHYLKVLGAIGEKYKIDKPQDVFIPDDLPKELPVKPATTLSDDFNRTDENPLGTASGGGTWQSVSVGIAFGVVSNRASTAVTANDGFSRLESDLSTADHYAQADVISFDFKVGPAARFASAASTFYTGYLRNTTTYRISKVVATSETLLDSAAITVSLPEAYKTECNGSTITIYQAGVSRKQITDTAITTGTRCGLYGAKSSANAVMDNWSADDLAAPAGHPAMKRFGGVKYAMARGNGVW